MKNSYDDPTNSFLKKTEQFIKDLRILVNEYSEELRRQSPEIYQSFMNVESGFEPSRRRNLLEWRGTPEALTALYSETCLCEEEKAIIFDVGDENEFHSVFGPYVPEKSVRIRTGHISDVIFLFDQFTAPEVRLIGLWDSLQKIMPLLFETQTGPVKYGTVKSRKNLNYAIGSEKRRRHLMKIVEKVTLVNSNSKGR